MLKVGGGGLVEARSIGSATMSDDIARPGSDCMVDAMRSRPGPRASRSKRRARNASEAVIVIALS